MSRRSNRTTPVRILALLVCAPGIVCASGCESAPPPVHEPPGVAGHEKLTIRISGAW